MRQGTENQAQQLLEARRTAGLSQEALALHLGVSRQQISRIEKGQSDTTHANALKWLAFCGFASDVRREETGELSASDRGLLDRVDRLLRRMDDRDRQMLVGQLNLIEQRLDDDSTKSAINAETRARSSG